MCFIKFSNVPFIKQSETSNMIIVELSFNKFRLNSNLLNNLKMAGLGLFFTLLLNESYL